MATGRSICLRLLITSLVAVAVVAIPCQRPISSQECAAIRVSCLAFTPRQCTDTRGTFIKNGGFCGYCDVCARFEGEGQRCNTTVGSPGVGRVLLESICRKPLVCSARNEGVCVHPRQCRF